MSNHKSLQRWRWKRFHEHYQYIRSLAGEKVIVLDAFAVLANEGGTIRPENSQDTLHLNARGYEKLNVELTHLLTTLGSP